MNLTITLGTEKDVDSLEQLYNELNDYLASGINYPGWRKNIYPVRETARVGVEEKTLYVVWDNKKIAGTIILNQKPENAYKDTKWPTVCDDSEVYVIHTFAVHPDYMKAGIGKRLMEHAVSECKKKNGRCIRLDVGQKNYPAIRFYENFGYKYVNTVDLGLGEYGLPWFRLYELEV